MNKVTLIVGLCLFGFLLLINMADSKPQLTFSTNWDGGKRSSDYNDLDSRLYEDRLLVKRRPGWGKRATFDLKNHPEEVKAARFNNIYRVPNFVKAYDQYMESDENK